MTKSDRIKGGIFGHLIGDALGVPYEFMMRGFFNCIDMVGEGTHGQPAGTYSDDGAMMLCTIDSMVSKRLVDIEDIRSKFVQWRNNNLWTPHGEVFDIGNTTSVAIDNGFGGSSVSDNGNGSLMRILPLTWADADYSKVDEVSSITHGHSRSLIGCNYYITIARLLTEGKAKTTAKKLADFRTFLVYTDIDPEHTHYNTLWKSSFADTLISDIKSSGYVVDTLEAALWCFMNTDNYKDCVLKAVNLGDDTDTVAAVAGGLAGIYYGYNNIPQEWINQLARKEEIELLVNQFISVYED